VLRRVEQLLNNFNKRLSQSQSVLYSISHNRASEVVAKEEPQADVLGLFAILGQKQSRPGIGAATGYSTVARGISDNVPRICATSNRSEGIIADVPLAEV